MAENAGFDRLRNLINSAIDHTSNKNKTEKRQIRYPNQMQKRKEEGGDEDAGKSCDGRLLRPKIEFSLNKTSEKSFFGNTNKNQIFNKPNEDNDRNFWIPLH